MEEFKDIKTNIRRRFEFIEFCLNWDGKVGRPQLQDQFSISPQQATTDLTTYLDYCPGNMGYDPRQRAYIASDSFAPELISGEASEYFMHLEMLAKGYRTNSEVWIRNLPQVATVSVSSRPLSKATVKAIVQAINSESALLCDYASISSGGVSSRTLVPTALVSDGHRWHIRAYHLEKARYGDFVLTRMTRPEVIPRPEQPVPIDVEWTENIIVQFSAVGVHNEWRRSQLEYEYEMEGGKLLVSTSKALLFYVLRQYGFNPYDREENGMMRNVSSFQLEVSNLEEVEECLRRRG